MIKFNNQPCLEINNLWYVLHSSFNIALHHSTEDDILDEINSISHSSWDLFSEEEFMNALAKCNNSSTSSLDKLLWSHLKHVFKDKVCLNNIIRIANTCLDLGHWLSYFKISTTIVISKPNKSSYDMPKSFRPIVLLNTLGKLIEKVIGDRLQFHVISNNFIHQSQLGRLKFKFKTDADIALTYIICSGWVKNLPTSTLAFDITQFFLLLNHHLLSLILRKVGFDPQVVKFFSNYLISRKTHYFWNSFTSPSLDVNVRVGQSSALYLSLFLHILENCLKILKISISILSFVDNELLIAQSKSLHLLNFILFCSYNIVSNLLLKFGLIVEHSKTEVSHFTRSHGSFNPPLLDLSSIGGPILCFKNS